jgi:hypothetical protein
MLAEQLERSQQEVRDLQTERQQLTQQLEAIMAEAGEDGEEGGAAGGSPGRGSWRRLGGAGAELIFEQQLAVKEQEVAALRRQLEQLRARLQVGAGRCAARSCVLAWLPAGAQGGAPARWPGGPGS